MDISKCTGELCPIKNQCKRYTIKASGVYPEIPSPFRIEGCKFKCDLYYPHGAEFQFTTDLDK